MILVLRTRFCVLGIMRKGALEDLTCTGHIRVKWTGTETASNICNDLVRVATEINQAYTSQKYRSHNSKTLARGGHCCSKWLAIMREVVKGAIYVGGISAAHCYIS